MSDAASGGTGHQAQAPRTKRTLQDANPVSQLFIHNIVSLQMKAPRAIGTYVILHMTCISTSLPSTPHKPIHTTQTVAVHLFMNLIRTILSQAQSTHSQIQIISNAKEHDVEQRRPCHRAPSTGTAHQANPARCKPCQSVSQLFIHNIVSVQMKAPRAIGTMVLDRGHV